jgi:hypothetical protein
LLVKIINRAAKKRRRPMTMPPPVPEALENVIDVSMHAPPKET